MGNIQESPVSTNRISDECVITIRKKVHMVDYNFHPKNLYFAYFKQWIRKWL